MMSLATFQERERLRADRFWHLCGTIGLKMFSSSFSKCFPEKGPTEIPTDETFELLESALDLINQAIATLRKKPDLRVVQ